jgi:hypothetical protein
LLQRATEVFTGMLKAIPALRCSFLPSIEENPACHLPALEFHYALLAAALLGMTFTLDGRRYWLHDGLFLVQNLGILSLADVFRLWEAADVVGFSQAFGPRMRMELHALGAECRDR